MSESEQSGGSLETTIGNANQRHQSIARRVCGFVKRNPMLSSGVGLTVVGGAVSASQGDLGELATNPEVYGAAGMALAARFVVEAAFVGGAMIAADSIGERPPNYKAGLNVWARINALHDPKGIVYDSVRWRRGMRINTAAALGVPVVTSGFALTTLPHEMWPGILTMTTTGAVSTLMTRRGINQMARRSFYDPNATANRPVTEKASSQDLSDIVELDWRAYKETYESNNVTKDDVLRMMTSRLSEINNCGGWMYVQRSGGKIRGMLTAFRTSKPPSEFVSWENSTNNGTLQGSIDPSGKFIYVANLTVGPGGRKEELITKLYAEAIKQKIAYAYFESRIPGFARWMARNYKDTDGNSIVEPGAVAQVIEQTFSNCIPDDVIEDYARSYVNKKRADGVTPYDPELAMYTKIGAKLVKLSKGAFVDPDSFGFGMVGIVDVLFANRNYLVRKLAAIAIGVPSISKKIVG